MMNTKTRALALRAAELQDDRLKNLEGGAKWFSEDKEAQARFNKNKYKPIGKNLYTWSYVRPRHQRRPFNKTTRRGPRHGDGQNRRR